METKVKLIIVSSSPLTKRHMRELCPDDMAQWFDLEYWDLSALDPVIRHEKTLNSLVRPYVVTISNLKEFRNKLLMLPAKTLSIQYIRRDFSTYKIHQLLASKIDCAITMGIASAFYYDCEKNGISRLNMGFVNKTINAQVYNNQEKNTFNSIKHILYKNSLLQYVAKYVRYRGDYRFVQWRDVFYREKIAQLYKHVHRVGIEDADFPICTPDVDAIKQLLHKQSSDKDKYICFIDSYYPLHEDWKVRVPNFDWNALYQPYQDSLIHFFEKVEEKYGCEVRIAAHPNANYDSNVYGGRKIIQFNTVEMVKNASAIMMHAGSSISFVIYYNKPFCFITNSAFKAGNFERCPYSVTAKMAKELGVPFVDTDHAKSLDNIFQCLPPEKRLRYIDLYLGDTDSPLSYAEQLRDAIKSIYKII